MCKELNEGMRISSCRACCSLNVSALLDMGSQPISNRFLHSRNEQEVLFPLKLALCRDCGLIQLVDLIPVEELRPRFDWVTYNEPEDHLDSMVDRLAALPGISSDSAFLGISFKDDTTLHRFKVKGFSRMKRIDPVVHFGIMDKGVGIETIQMCISPEKMRQVAQKIGKADMVIVRHVLEHAYAPQRFLLSLKELMADGGYLVIEVPDCSRAVSQLDYTTIWEEHVVYFSPSTFRSCMEKAGFSIEGFDVYPCAFEDSLLCIARACKGDDVIKEDVHIALDVAQKFAYKFPLYRKKVRSVLAKYRQEKGKIAMFGAGHLACVYINFFGLKDFIEFVIDDNPNKKGLLMPGSQLPIVATEALMSQDVRLCLLALNPMSEAKVLARNRGFLLNDGEFLSIFPASCIALNLEGASA